MEKSINVLFLPKDQFDPVLCKDICSIHSNCDWEYVWEADSSILLKETYYYDTYLCCYFYENKKASEQGTMTIRIITGDLNGVII